MKSLLRLDDPEITVQIRTNKRARRFTLRLAGPGDGAILTVPPGVPRAEVSQFLDRHRQWLATALQRQPGQIPVRAGTVLPVDGQLRTVTLAGGGRKPPYLDGEKLVVSPQRATGPALATWLKARARANMVPFVEFYAGQLGRKVAGVALKDTKTRWGSCSNRARINLSWRIVMAPVEVQAYLCAHEAAHLVEMNHSPRFWALVHELMPDYATHRDWLKREGRRLHAYTFDAPPPTA